MAAEVVTLTDGTNSVDFLDGRAAPTGYVFNNIQGLDPPPVKIVYAGNRPIQREWQNREITITFGIQASDAADLESKKRVLVTILENTYRHWTTRDAEGAKAQLQYRKEGGTDISYADVYWGECDWGSTEYQAAAPYAAALSNAQLTLICESCFHPSAVVNLVNNQLVYQQEDLVQGYTNYADIAAANVKGDLDAPCNIKVSPADDWSPTDTDKFWIAMVGPRANIKHWGEVSMSYDANRSSSNKWLLTTSYDGWGRSVKEVSASGFMKISPTEWAAMSGRTWRVLMGAKAPTTSVEWKVEATTRAWVSGSEIVIHSGDPVYHPEASQWCIVDLGPLYIAQVMAGDYPGAGVFIGWRYNVHGVQSVVEVDFLCLIPEHRYSVHIDKTASALANYDYYYVNDFLYVKEAVDFPHHVFTESASENIGCLGSSFHGTYPRLVPGEDNRVIFLFAQSGDRSDLSFSYRVTIDYLPQYLTPLE